MIRMSTLSQRCGENAAFPVHVHWAAAASRVSRRSDTNANTANYTTHILHNKCCYHYARPPVSCEVGWYIKLEVPALDSRLLSNQNVWLKPNCYIKYVRLYHPSRPLVQSYRHHVLTDSAERFITVALTARITACCRGHAVCCYSDLVKEVEERRKSM